MPNYDDVDTWNGSCDFAAPETIAEESSHARHLALRYMGKAAYYHARRIGARHEEAYAAAERTTRRAIALLDKALVGVGVKP